MGIGICVSIKTISKTENDSNQNRFCRLTRVTLRQYCHKIFVDCWVSVKTIYWINAKAFMGFSKK